MNNEELKKALYNKTPVSVVLPMQGKIYCDYVSAIVYRLKDEHIVTSAELTCHGNSVIIADPDKIKSEE